MKVQILISVMLCLVILFGCSKDTSAIGEPTGELDINSLEFVHSEKGWELYSWYVGNDWNYSILYGTNRFKSLDEVKENKVQVIGEEKLMAVLKKIPNGDKVTWIGTAWLDNWQTNYDNLELPPQEIINNIKLFCDKINLDLQVTD